MKPAELRMLAEIAGLIADRDLAALAVLKAESAALAERAEALTRPAQPTQEDTLDPAARAGAGERWERWRQEELRRIQAERARLAIAEEAARDVARRSFGRQIALSELSGKTP